MNYFNPKTAAERYSKGRPDFHSNTIKHIKDYLHLDKKLNNALDIACGTGLSTKALFDIDKFLMEASRLLKSKSWLVLYENYFISEMVGNDNFTNWFPNVYLKKYPSPPRNNVYFWTNENLIPKNFNFVIEERFRNSITFNKKKLALYFTTQSNIIAAVEKNQTTYEQVENWLDQELASFFDNDDTTQTINYGNWIKFIQRAN